MKKKGLSILIALGKPMKKKQGKKKVTDRVRSLAPKIKKHLHEDIKGYHHEVMEDKELLKDIDAHYKSRPGNSSKKHSSKSNSPKVSRRDGKLIKLGKKENKIRDVMEEFKFGKLHSGSKKGPKVKSRKQAIAIALSEARRKKRK